MITGAPEAILAVGGVTSSGPAKGVYRIKVNDSSIGAGSKKTGRVPLVLDLYVTGDNNHPEKEGKRLEKYRQWLPMASDDKEKKATMNGMLMRQVYIPFGITFPKDEKGTLDPRIFAGKTAYVLVGDVKQEDGTFRNGIVSMAAEAEKLPQPRTTETGATDAPKRSRR